VLPPKGRICSGFQLRTKARADRLPLSIGTPFILFASDPNAEHPAYAQGQRSIGHSRPTWERCGRRSSIEVCADTFDYSPTPFSGEFSHPPFRRNAVRMTAYGPRSSNVARSGNVHTWLEGRCPAVECQPVFQPFGVKKVDHETLPCAFAIYHPERL